MKRNRKLLFLSLSFGLFAGPLWAQGSGTTAPPRPSYEDHDRPYEVTQSVTGIVEELDLEGGAMVIVDEKSGQRWAFKTGEETRFKADKAVLGRKEIHWGDLQTGHRVKVTFKTASQGGSLNYGQDVVEIRLRKPKKG